MKKIQVGLNVIIMKRIIFGFVLVVSFGVVRAQDIYSLPEFSKVLVSGKILLEMREGDTNSLEIVTRGYDSTCIIQEIVLDQFTLKTKSFAGCNEEVAAILTCPRISELFVEGNAELTSKKLYTADTVIIESRSGSKVFIDFNVKYLEADVSEGALISTEGYADKLSLTISTKGSFSGFDLESETADVFVNLGGNAKINVVDDLKVKASTKGVVTYKGEPKKTKINEMLGGEVKPYSELIE